MKIEVIIIQIFKQTIKTNTNELNKNSKTRVLFDMLFICD